MNPREVPAYWEEFVYEYELTVYLDPGLDAREATHETTIESNTSTITMGYSGSDPLWMTVRIEKENP